MIKCGIPQGSILGSLFFLLYINHLPQCLSKTKPRLFADDTNLTGSGDSIPHLETAMNSDLENLRKWLIANRLTLNVAKTEFMLIESIYVTLVSLYNAIVRPYFDYCCEVWDVFGETQSKRLQKLQNRAAIIIMNMSNDVHHSFVLQALGWKTLEAERKKAKGKMMYKLLNNMGPQSLANLFTYKDEVTGYNLRNISSSLCLPHPHTNNMKRSFMDDGAFLWNSIPRDIKDSKSLSSFRTKIATHIDS